MGIFDRIRALFGGSTTNGNGAGGGMAEVEMISCHDALVLVHEYLDGELDDVPEAQVKAHFDVCQACYPHLHLETVCRDAIRRAASGQVAPPEVKTRIMELLAEADEEG